MAASLNLGAYRIKVLSSECRAQTNPRVALWRYPVEVQRHELSAFETHSHECNDRANHNSLSPCDLAVPVILKVQEFLFGEENTNPSGVPLLQHAQPTLLSVGAAATKGSASEEERGAYGPAGAAGLSGMGTAESILTCRRRSLLCSEDTQYERNAENAPSEETNKVPAVRKWFRR